MREPVDPRKAADYPANIQAILKRPGPASDVLGLDLIAFDREAGRVEVAFEADERLTNKWGGLHGGMVAAMLDDCMSIAVGLTLEWGQITPTLEMKTSFLSAGKPGRLLGEGWTVKRGGSVAFVEAALTDADGEPVARGSSTVRIVTLKK
jgi:uncharacterized protein (TIGR00369 family)